MAPGDRLEDDEAHRREAFISVRKRDLVEAILADGLLVGTGERDAARQFVQLLSATFHYESFGELERLRDDYHAFNPEHGEAPAGPAVRSAAYEELRSGLGRLLERANFIEIAPEEHAAPGGRRGLIPVEVRTETEGYREIRMFRRGRHTETTTRKRWFRKHPVTTAFEVYDDVILYAAARPEPPPAKKRGRRPKIRHGAVLIKYFRNIPRADLASLYPEVRVVMHMRDRWLLGLPALVAGIPILIKLLPTITILLLLAGIRLSGQVVSETDTMAQAIVVLGGLFALGGFVMAQITRFQRQTLRYRLAIHENVYFRNVNNNAGIFDALVGAAEEQDCKEALLAYFFLRAADRPLSEAELDHRIEAWLETRFGVHLDFEIGDGVAKLERLALLSGAEGPGPMLAAVPLDAALRRLDARWDALFAFPGSEVATQAA